MALNERRPQLLVDPTVDLASEPQTLLPANWIMSLDESHIIQAHDVADNDVWGSFDIRTYDPKIGGLDGLRERWRQTSNH